jgi:hypothetical protein
MTLEPIRLGPAKAISQDSVHMIQKSLYERMHTEQIARKDLTPDFNKWLSDQILERLPSNPDDLVEAMTTQVRELFRDSSFIAQFKEKYLFELTTRLESDSGISIVSELLQSDSDNTMYLRNLLPVTGWIDVKRFGVEASVAACILVQHSSDIRLMLSVIGEIEKDRDFERINQIYPLMKYRVRLFLGAEQDELDRIMADYKIH